MAVIVDRKPIRVWTRTDLHLLHARLMQALRDETPDKFDHTILSAEIAYDARLYTQADTLLERAGY